MKVLSPIKYANDHPWIYVVLAFAVLVAAWTTFFILAIKNRPAPLPLPHSEIVNPQSSIE